MNSSTLPTLISLHPLRQWIARCLPHALPQPPSHAPHAPHTSAPAVRPAHYGANRGDVAQPKFAPLVDNTPDTGSVQVDRDCLAGKNDDLAALFGQQEFYKIQFEDLLAAHYYAAKNLMALAQRRQQAFETIFSARDDITRFDTEPEQAGVAHFKTLLLECNNIIHELRSLDHSLILAFQMLKMNVLEATYPRTQVPHPTQE